MEDNSESSKIDHKYDDSEKRTELSKDDLNRAEESTTSSESSDSIRDEEGASLWKQDEKPTETPRKSKGLLSRRTKIIGGVGLGGGIIGLIIAGFMALIPLKIEHIVKNLEKKFFATSQNAMSKELDKLYANYITERVLPGYRKCGTTIDRSCSALSLGRKDPIGNLYDSWSKARFENTLADKYGISFELEKNKGLGNQTWRIRTKDTTFGAGGNCTSLCSIGANGEKLGQVIESTSTSDIRRTIKSTLDGALENETSWKKVYTRYKVGKLLENKYGIRRCLFFCGIKDPINDKIAVQKKAFNMMLIKKVIEPRSAYYGVVLSCVFDAKNCSPEKIDSPDPTVPEENGQPTSSQEREASRSVQEEVSKIESKAIDQVAVDVAEKAGYTGTKDVAKAVEYINNKGLGAYFIKTLLAKVLADQVAQNAADFVPVVGWINRIASYVGMVDNIGPAIKKLRYITVTAEAAQIFSMYNTYASEIHTGKVTSTELGSMSDALSPGNHSLGNDAQVGGNAGAEQTPLYQYLVNGLSKQQSISSVSNKKNNNIASLILPSAFAGTTSSSIKNDYTCNDGNNIPSGELICPEEQASSNNVLLDTLHNIVNVGVGPFSLAGIASLWNGTIGKIWNIVGSAVGVLASTADSLVTTYCKAPVTDLTPGCDAYVSIKNSISDISAYVEEKVINDPISASMSGGRIFNMMAMGADVAGNDSAHVTLGGKQLTDQQVASINSEENKKDQYSESKKPLFAKLFDTNSQYSLISKIAMAIPLNSKDQFLGNIISSVVSVPYKLIGNFGSILNGRSLAVDSTVASDPFGIIQYGYPEGSLSADPQKYWNDNCVDDSSKAYQKDNSWNNEMKDPKNIDSNTGMAYNTSTNECLLIKATVGAAGGIFDTSNLNTDDLSGSSAQ